MQSERVEDTSLGEPLEFLGSLWSLVHALDKRSKWMATRHGVTGPQRMAVRLVGRIPGITAGALAKRLRLHPSTVTGVLQRLEDRGFVARAKDTSDGRRAMLVLTRDGRAIDRTREGTIESAVETVVSRFDAARLAVVRDFIDALTAELERDLDR